jgi:hypothetical protein
MLKEEKIIRDNLGSKEILKMFQALTNESYVYFPVFKGFLVQAESKIYTLYKSACGPSGCSRQYSFHPFNSLMFSGIYGLPVNNKLSLVGSIYSTFPVTNKYLNDYIYYEFNSPVTLIVRNSIDPNYSGIFDQYNSNYNEIALKMNLGLNLNGFYSFNSFCGTSARIYANVKLNDFPGKDEIDGGINTNFDFNILNHLNLRLYFNYRAYSNVDHYYIIGTDLSYRVF